MRYVACQYFQILSPRLLDLSTRAIKDLGNTSHPVVDEIHSLRLLEYTSSYRLLQIKKTVKSLIARTFTHQHTLYWPPYHMPPLAQPFQKSLHRHTPQQHRSPASRKQCTLHHNPAYAAYSPPQSSNPGSKYISCTHPWPCFACHRNSG